MSDRTNAANPLFEAMICGRPGVVLDTGATSRVIDDGVNGWLVPEAEPEALGPLLARLLGEPSCLRETGARAREWALKHVPTWSERQRMEVEIVERAVAEARAESRRKDRARS
jgi:glycosyltransferase involved in cell wall biosynthesis